jgi:hypothetical protein
VFFREIKSLSESQRDLKRQTQDGLWFFPNPWTFHLSYIQRKLVSFFIFFLSSISLFAFLTNVSRMEVLFQSWWLCKYWDRKDSQVTLPESHRPAASLGLGGGDDAYREGKWADGKHKHCQNGHYHWDGVSILQPQLLLLQVIFFFLPSWNIISKVPENINLNFQKNYEEERSSTCLNPLLTVLTHLWNYHWCYLIWYLWDFYLNVNWSSK